MAESAGGRLAVVFDRPEVDEVQAAAAAELYWNLTGRLRELPSERDRNFLIETDEGPRFVLKFGNAAEHRALLDLQHEVLARIKNHDPNLGVPAVRPAADGSALVAVDLAGGPHWARVLTWVDGVPLAEAKPKTGPMLESLGGLLGAVDRALDGFDHPAAHRSLKWDLARVDWIREHLGAIEDRRRRHLVERFLGLFDKVAAPAWSGLPQGIVHNDANDYNVLVAASGADPRPTVGLIDFGDLVWTARVSEVAIASAYAMLGMADPVGAAASVIGGYHAANPLTEAEIEVAFALIKARLCTSVVNAAVQRQAKPDNEYLAISERPAWELLTRLVGIHPRLAHYRFRDACGLEPCPVSPRVRAWLRAKADTIVPIVNRDQSGPKPPRVDLSISSPFIDQLTLLSDEPRLTRKIKDLLDECGARVGVGEWDEPRLVYTTEQYRTDGMEGTEWRTIHIGLDLFAEVGTPVRTPLPGRVRSVRNNALPADYGPTVIVEHSAQDAQGRFRFWTLYGHLDRETLRDVAPGQPLAAGAPIGRLGSPAVNGGWSPHVHFQVIVDLLDREGEFPGVARPSERRVWRSLSPDPHDVAGFPDTRDPQADGTAIAARRRTALGTNLSISYRRPLHIVRGWMQHLYDAEGRRYLDAVNNVPHVGHCHPAVTRAGQRQMAVLNTNTRYLHETVVRYAERLTATLPRPLDVCYFVNSGSEANELALRLAAAHSRRIGTIVVDGAYHGNTSTLVGLSPYKCEGPGGLGLAPNVRKIPIPDPYRGRHRGPDTGPAYAAFADQAIDALARAGTPVGAFLCESILSCGGQIVLPPRFLAEVYQRVRQAGAVAIADEVQVGFARVGTHFWGFQTQEVVPDIVVMGKPAGNGHPLGIVVTTPAIAASFANGMEYFSTFGGNPVSAAIGLAVLDVIERDRLQWRALETGGYLIARLTNLMAAHQAIGDVRGLGLFVGVELVKDRESREPDAKIASYLANRMRDKGVLLSTDGPDHNVLKIKPPLVFGPADADQLVAALDQALAEDGAQR